MEVTETRKKRMKMISNWSKRKSGSLERSPTPEPTKKADVSPVQVKRKLNAGRRNSKGKRECLIPIANELHPCQDEPLPVPQPQVPVDDVTEKENKAEVSIPPIIDADDLPTMSDEKAPVDNTNQQNDALDDLPLSNIAIEEETSKATDEIMAKEDEVPFAVGDLVWAFIPGSPLWPSLITLDGVDGIHMKLKGKRQARVYHVEFFGDKGYHSWLSTTVLFPFLGSVEELLKDSNFLKHVNKKTKLFKAVPQTNDTMTGKKKNWPTALEEGKTCLNLPRDERVTFLRKMIQQRDEERLERKRKMSLEGENVRPKRQKRLRLSKESSADEPETPESVEETEESEEKVAVLLQQEVEADEVLKEYKKKREKEKKSAEMRIEVCECCGTRDGRLLPCDKCRTAYHPACLKKDPEVSELVCNRCDPAVDPSCSLCQGTGGELMTCSVKLCSRRYHKECLMGFHSPSEKQEKPRAQFTCPAHYCHTCVAELGELHPPDKKQMLRCIECPTSYHSSESCLAAGCVPLSVSQMKCFKHVEKRSGGKKRRPIHYNINWCMLCTEGGSLMCCERCPSSFHTKCLGLDREPEGSYLCAECINGKTILHGDIVWCKIGSYRWWPGRVYPLDVIPVQHQKYRPKAGEFLVYFYGSHNSAFVYRGQVFHFQDGDKGARAYSKSQMAEDFKLAIELVTPAFQERQKELAEQAAERRLKVEKKPPAYNKIRSNKPIGNVRILETGPDSSSQCDCKDKNLSDPCGPDSNCLNRMLLTECHPSVCSANCANQSFQKRLTPPLYPFKTNGKGWGLKSRAAIKKGDFVVEYCGELIDNQEFQRRLKAKQDARDEAYYFLTLDNQRMIDAGPSGNLARFMNHSCHPNCETQKWTVLGDTRVGLFAVEDIPADTELTFNYQLECARDVDNESNKRQQQCNCGAPNCAGFIGAKPKQVEMEKGTKPVKTKKKQKQRRSTKAKVAEDFCFRCYEGGCLVMCDVKACHKVYHVDCLSLEAPPKGHWTCPWHHCDECGRKSVQFCAHCPSSLCSTHEAEWKKHDQLGLVCNEHTLEELEFFLKRQMESESAPANASPEPSASSCNSSEVSSLC